MDDRGDVPDPDGVQRVEGSALHPGRLVPTAPEPVSNGSPFGCSVCGAEHIPKPEPICCPECGSEHHSDHAAAVARIVARFAGVPTA